MERHTVRIIPENDPQTKKTRRKRMTQLRAVLSRLADSVRCGSLGRNYKWEQDLMTYARTEYKKDWQFAYNYMLNNNGKGPKMGVWR